MRFQACLIVPLFGLMVSGAAVAPPPPSDGQQSLPNTMAVSGSDIDLEQDDNPCGPNQTVLTCAKNIAKSWEVPKSTKCAPQKIKIPVSLFPGALDTYIEPLVYVEASDCALSQPVVTSQGEPFYCSTFWCQKQFSFATTVTKSESFGMSSTLTISLSAEVDVPLLAKFTTTITGSETQEWQETTTKSTLNTTVTSWTLQNGQMCEPTTVQYGVQCNTIIRIADSATQWTAMLRINDKVQTPMNINCGMADALKLLPGSKDKNQAFWEFCQAIKADEKKTTINVGLSGSPDGIWSLQGCMWPTVAKDNA